MKDSLISRQAAIELIHSLYPSAPIMPMNRKRWEKKYKPYIEAEKALEMLPPVQPEITDEQAIGHLQASGWMQSHDKQMYEMGLKERLADDSDSYDALLPPLRPELFGISEQMDGEYDPKPDIYYLAEKIGIHRLYALVAQLQPTCNNLATDCISRKAALDGIADYLEEYDGIDENGNHDLKWCAMKEAELLIKELPSVQPAINCSEIPNTSDFVSRKTVRDMVATWSYDMAEWEDVELALSDVDKLPSAHPEVIHCNDCALWNRTGCPMNVFAEKPEPGYFCGTGRRKENE